MQNTVNLGNSKVDLYFNAVLMNMDRAAEPTLLILSSIKSTD